MAIQTAGKPNGTSVVPKQAVAIRPFSVFNRDPFRTFDGMRQLMDELFDARVSRELGTELEPAINVYEKDGDYTIECAVPGYKKDDITVEARGDEVTISGTYSEEKTDDKNHYHRHEMRQGSFSRTVALPQDVDPEHVAAKLENGMLKITLHPTKAIKSKTIPVTG